MLKPLKPLPDQTTWDYRVRIDGVCRDDLPRFSDAVENVSWIDPRQKLAEARSHESRQRIVERWPDLDVMRVFVPITEELDVENLVEIWKNCDRREADTDIVVGCRMFRRTERLDLPRHVLDCIRAMRCDVIVNITLFTDHGSRAAVALDPSPTEGFGQEVPHHGAEWSYAVRIDDVARECLEALKGGFREVEWLDRREEWRRAETETQRRLLEQRWPNLDQITAIVPVGAGFDSDVLIGFFQRAGMAMELITVILRLELANDTFYGVVPANVFLLIQKMRCRAMIDIAT